MAGARFIPRGMRRWEQRAELITTAEVVQMYNQGFAGCYSEPAESELLLASMSSPDGEQVAYDSGMVGDGAGKLSLPYIFAFKNWPLMWPCPGQTTGDCSRADAMVRMADGSLKRIADVTVGEYVVSAANRRQVVTGVIKKPYAGQLTRVTVAGFAVPLELTPDHLVVTCPEVGNVATGNRDKRQWKPVGQLHSGEYLFLPRGIDEDASSTPVFDLVEFCDVDVVTEDMQFDVRQKRSNGSIYRRRLLKPKAGSVRVKNGRQQASRYVRLDERLAWLFGLYLAEGSMDYQDENPVRITLNLGSHRRVHAEQAREYFKEIFGVDVRVYSTPSKPTVIYVRCHNMLVASLFAKLCPGDVYTKRMPAQMMATPRATRIACLRGWFDGDGHISASNAGHAGSSSFGLADDMFSLGNSCGLRLHTSDRPARGHSREYRECYVPASSVARIYTDGCGPTAESHDTVVQDKDLFQDRLRLLDDGLAVEVLQVETIDFDEEFVHCLVVDRDESFICDGYGVHNCVSHAGKNSALVLIGVEAALAKPDPVTGIIEGFPVVTARAEAQGVVACENIYGDRGSRGSGASCSRLQNYVTTKGGIMLRQPYPELNLDLTDYNASIGIAWGGSGVPDKVNVEGKKHQIREATDCPNHEVCRDFIANGYPIWACSSLGWSSSKDANGYSRRSGSWSHSWIVMGYDDRADTISKYGFPLFLYNHDWAKWNSGGSRILGTTIDIPDGAFWADARLLDQCETRAMASVNGWARQAPQMPDFQVL